MECNKLSPQLQTQNDQFKGNMFFKPSETAEKDNIYKLTRSISISDMSLISHVFLDKTGTITEDQLEV